jgi:hypothetical protein
VSHENVVYIVAAGSGVGYKAFTLILSGCVTDKRTEKYGVQQLKKCVYSAGFLARSEGVPVTSGNIRLNAAPLAVSGSSSDPSSC